MGSLASIEPQTGRTVRVGERDIFVVELGEGPPLVMLHGGGPGASGMSNFSRNIPALARRFRLIVPDLPGYGRSTKGLDRNDPFGDLARSMLGLLDALSVGEGPCTRQLARRRVRAAPGARGAEAGRSPRAARTRRRRHEPQAADRGPAPSARLLFRRRPHAREMRTVPAQGPGVRRRGAARRR